MEAKFKTTTDMSSYSHPDRNIDPEFEERFRKRMKTYGINLPKDDCEKEDQLQKDLVVGKNEKSQFDLDVEEELRKMREQMNINLECSPLSPLPTENKKCNKHAMHSQTQELLLMEPLESSSSSSGKITENKHDENIKSNFESIYSQQSHAQSYVEREINENTRNEPYCHRETNSSNKSNSSQVTTSHEDERKTKQMEYAKQLREQIAENLRRKEMAQIQTKGSTCDLHKSRRILKEQSHVEKEKLNIQGSKEGKENNLMSRIDLPTNVNSRTIPIPSDIPPMNVDQEQKKQSNAFPSGMDTPIHQMRHEKRRKQKLYAQQLAEQIAEKKLAKLGIDAQN